MLLFCRQRAFKGFALSAVLSGLTAQAQTASHVTNVEPQPVERTIATQDSNGRSIVIARPLEPEATNNDLEAYFMPDELVDQMESRYYQRIRDYSLKQGFYENARDTRLKRTYGGSPAEEQAMRQEMAEFMKRYMIRKGIPKYLSSKKQTRFIGEQYQKAETLVQNASRIEISSKSGNKDAWKFGTGINPMNTKAWMKYSNTNSSIELYNYFDRHDKLCLSLTHQQGMYLPSAEYNFLDKSLDTGVKFRHSGSHESQLRTSFPLGESGSLKNVRTSISSTYRF
ncbi:MAG: hypothetical protein ABIR96_08055 [Bdellovibrionota bacterium]